MIIDFFSPESLNKELYKDFLKIFKENDYEYAFVVWEYRLPDLAEEFENIGIDFKFSDHSHHGHKSLHFLLIKDEESLNMIKLTCDMGLVGCKRSEIFNFDKNHPF